MIWKKHLELKDKHAFLSPSGYHWINYDEDKLVATYNKHMAVQRGTDLHALACECIRLGVRLPNSKNNIFNMYVNDAIGYRMTPEQPLYYSENCFGTADAISFISRKTGDFLRIHDLKTGVSPTSMNQLKIYAAIFCLEYGIDPLKIDSEFRIYQNPEIKVYIPERGEIQDVANKIIQFDAKIEYIKAGN